MRVLVTGSSGHVGGAIAAHLASLGHHVIGLGRSGGAGEGVAQETPADLSDPDAWPRLGSMVPALDAVVHAAASLDFGPAAADVALVNAGGTQAVADLAASRDAALVFVSSLGVIGVPRAWPVTEEHPVDPPTAYHASKLFGEQITALAGRRGIPAASLRLTSPVGPGMPGGRILPVFAARAAAGEPLRVAGRGTRRQDYIDVRDIATATAAALERRATGVFNVAAGVAVANEELARRCVALAGSASEVVVGEGPDPQDDVAWEVSIARARDELDWAPRLGVDDAIGAALP